MRHRLLILLPVLIAVAVQRARRPAPAGEIYTARAVDRSPEPTEDGMDEAVEKRGHTERDAWIEPMHRTGPGVDWRAIELANAERDMRRRNRMAQDSSLVPLGGPWKEVGSANLAGRMWCATIASAGSTIYSGSA